jgi:acetate kinase
MDDYTLIINSGLSGLKFCVYHRPDIGSWEVDARGAMAGGPGTTSRNTAALAAWVRSTYGAKRILGVGHRVVQGGRRFAAPVLITPLIMEELQSLVRLAPLHQPLNLAAIDVIAELLPGVPQVACFDTSFHRRQSDIYGFHGLSYEHIASVLPQAAPEIANRRVMVAHLDESSSLCAMRERKSVDTLGIFGSYHMLDALTLGDASARLAIADFVERVATDVASLASAADGIDGLVFTGEIGEKHAEIRAAICEALAWMRITLDVDANTACGPRITRRDSEVSAWVIPTNTELVIARHTAMLLGLVETHA